MPKVFKQMGAIMKSHSNASPVMVFLTPKEMETETATLKMFSDGGGVTIITNRDALFSPVNGAALSPVENATDAKLQGEDFKALDELIAMRCEQCDVVAGVGQELAFHLVDEEMNCPVCNKETRFKYEAASDDLEDMSDSSSDDDDDDSSEDDDDDTSFSDLTMEDDDDSDSDDDSDMDGDDDSDGSDDDDDSSEDDDDDSEMAGDFGDEDDDSDDDSDITSLDDGDATDDDEDDSADSDDDATNNHVVDVADDGSDFTIEGTPLKTMLDKYKAKVSVDNGQGEPMTGSIVRVLNVDTVVFKDDAGATHTIKIDSIEDGEGMGVIKGTQREVESANLATQEVYAVEMANFDQSIRIADLSGNRSEMAVFVGGVHVGTLRQSSANEIASAMYADGNRLFAAFKPTLTKNASDPSSSELAKFGFEPTKFTVNVGDLYSRRLEKATAQAVTKAAADAAVKVSGMYSTLSLAAVGINKGVFQVKNDLATEIANVFRASGVANADVEARKLLANKSSGYFKAVIETAQGLSEKSADYLKGVEESITSADFISTGKEQPAKEIATSLIDPVTRTPEVASGFVGSPTTTTKPGLNPRFAAAVKNLRSNRR